LQTRAERQVLEPPLFIPYFPPPCPMLVPGISVVPGLRLSVFMRTPILRSEVSPCVAFFLEVANPEGVDSVPTFCCFPMCCFFCTPYFLLFTVVVFFFQLFSALCTSLASTPFYPPVCEYPPNSSDFVQRLSHNYGGRGFSPRFGPLRCPFPLIPPFVVLRSHVCLPFFHSPLLFAEHLPPLLLFASVLFFPLPMPSGTFLCEFRVFGQGLS